MNIEHKINELENELAIAGEDLVKLLCLLVSYYEDLDQYRGFDSSCYPPSVESHVKYTQDLIKSLQPPLHALAEKIEQGEAKLRDLKDIIKLRAEIVELGDRKREIEQQDDDYESSDEWIEVRLDIGGCHRQIELLKENLDE